MSNVTKCCTFILYWISLDFIFVNKCMECIIKWSGMLHCVWIFLKYECSHATSVTVYYLLLNLFVNVKVRICTASWWCFCVHQGCFTFWSMKNSMYSHFPVPTPALSSLCHGWSSEERCPSAVPRLATLPLSLFTQNPFMVEKCTGECVAQGVETFQYTQVKRAAF